MSLDNFFSKDDFQSDLGRPPLLMVLNPGATKEKVTGFWLKAEEAANSGFAVGGSGWDIPEWLEETSVSFKRAQEGEAGFCFHRFRGIVLHNSRRVIQRQTEQGWAPCGAWDECPEEQNLIEQRSNVVRVRYYYLIILVNENNEPIHSTPLLLSLGAGPGAAIGSFLFKKEGGYYRDADRVVWKFLQQTLSPKGRASVVVDFALGEADTGQASFMAPMWGVKPVEKEESPKQKTEFAYNNREIVRDSVPLDRLLIPREWKPVVEDLWEQYKDWIPQRYYKDKPTPSSEPTPEPTPSSYEDEF